MSKKVKLIPVDVDTFTQYKEYLPQTPPIEILAPRSYEQSSEFGDFGGVGVLGNNIAGSRFYLNREYNFNWIGDKKEIDRIRFLLTNTSKSYFMFSGLNDNPILTPTVMFDSKSMLASLVDQYKPTTSPYTEMLVRYDMPDGGMYKRGSAGVALTTGQIQARQFNIMPSSARGASGYVLLEAGKSYRVMLDLNYMNDHQENVHVMPFEAVTSQLSPENFGGIVDHRFMMFQKLWSYSEIGPFDHDSILQIKLASPTVYADLYNNSLLRGVLNYSAPIIAEEQHVTTYDTFRRALIDSYADTPSLLTPSNSGVYNILSPTLAEFSISFKEIVNVFSK